ISMLQPARAPPAAIKAVELSGLSVVDDGEKIAADAVGHRRDETHHGVSGDGSIDSIAAPLQHLHAGLRRQRRFRRDDAIARYDHGSALIAVLGDSGRSG